MIPYGYCGMPCALCSRYRTQGTSKCNGCSHDGYYTDMCKVHRCCREKTLEHCGACQTYPCARLGKMSDFKDLHTNNVKVRTCQTIAHNSFSQWYQEYVEKDKLLTEALNEYNNGRMKRYLCELYIQKDLKTLRQIMELANNLPADEKRLGQPFKNIVEQVCGEQK